MVRFMKMDACGNDYIYIEEKAIGNRDPGELAVQWSDRHHGIGADGLVLIGDSKIADARMRMFNADGSEGKMCGNAVRCVGMLVHEKRRKNPVFIETVSGIRTVYSGLDDITVDMGKAILEPSRIPVQLPGNSVVNQSVFVHGAVYRITCVSMGNPHCVIFTENVETVDTAGIGSAIETCETLFPERVNTEFVEIVDSRTLKMRVWERGSGETGSCGTGACAAVTAAVLQGMCREGDLVSVQLRGGILQVRYTPESVFMKGPAVKVYEGQIF